MISIQTLIAILFCHWIFDFALQTREMGNNKSKSNYYLGQHVGVYLVGLLFLSFVLFPSDPWGCGFIWSIVNAVAHFLTDYVTSRATSSLYKEKRYHEFFLVIGIDQMIHYVTLFGTYVWFKN